MADYDLSNITDEVETQTPLKVDNDFSNITDEVSSTPSTNNFTPDFTGTPAYEDLAQHTPWLKATEIVYNIGKNQKTKWQGTDEELAQYGIEHMSFFNSNFSLGMGVDAIKLASATPEQKEAFLYLMETYDEIDEPNLQAIGRYAKGMFTDPLTYVGITTFGAGFFGKEAAKATTKQGLKELLKQGIVRGGTIGTIEGGMFGAYDATIRETIRVGGSDQESIDWSNVAKGTGIGMAAGATLGTALDVGITKVTNKLTRKNRLAELKAERLNSPEKTAEVETKVVEADAKAVETEPKIVERDTRGQGQQYHGTSTELGELGEGYDSYSSMNIYGQGFYTTDALDVAGGYSKKGKGGNPTRYRVIKTKNAKLYDLDQPLNDETIDMLSETTEFNREWLADLPENPTVRDVFDDLREWSGSEGIPADEVQEMFDGFKYLLEQKGFQGYSHKGGGFTNTKEHHVEIFWNPKEHIKLEKIETLNTKPKVEETPDLPPVQDVDGMPIDIPYFNTALTAPLRNLEAITKRAEELIPDIIKMSPARFVKVAEQIRNSELTVESRANLDQVVQGVRDHFLREQEKKLSLWAKATNPEEKTRLRVELAEAEVNLGVVNDLDSDLAGAAGMALKQRDNLFISGKGYTIKELREEFPDLSTDELLYKQQDAIAEGRAKSRIKQVTYEYDLKLAEALEAKKVALYLKTFREKRKAIDDIMQEEGAILAGKEKGAVKEALYKFAAPAVEITISNAFSVSTLLLNIGVSSLKTFYRPALDFVIGGKWNKQARLEMMAGYAGVKAMRTSAFKVALTSAKYEKQVATFETNKMFDEDITIKGVKGAILRTFPRLLLASDSFLQDINYRGHVASRATNNAYEEALAKGLKGKELDDFVKAQVKTKVDEAYDTTLRKETIDAIYRKGKAKGFEGEALDKWVADSLEKDASGLFSYNDKGALEYSNDILFKKEFSGKGLLSGSAAKYEKAVREWPVAKLMLNLFWRTPVRVFEEGIRLTPALNTVSSQKFRDDLIGKNGNKAQLRARGEMILGQAIVLDAMAMMSAGYITGANHPEHPYSIRVWDEDGEEQWWSYRLADPLSTPIKIIVNTLEEYQILLLRQQQEGRVDKKALEKFWDDNSVKVQAGLIGITTTLSDARLLTGFSKAYEGLFGDSGIIAQAVNDPTDEDKPVVSKKMFEMMSAIFPRQAYKLYERDDPTRYQTASFENMIRKNALPYYNVLEEYGDPLLEQLGVDLDIESFRSRLTPSFDINGVPLTNPDPMASNLIFSATKESQFQKGLNEDQIVVRDGLYKLSLDANTSFFHPYRYKAGYGDEDLRNIYTKATADRPEESYMSRWMHYYRELAPEGDIRDILEDDSIATGVPNNSKKVNEIRTLMQEYKAEAWEMLAEDEPDVMERLEEIQSTKDDVDDGLFDTIK